MHCLPTTMLQNTHWLRAKNLHVKCLTSWICHLNAIIHLCIVKRSFFYLKIWPAQHSKSLTHSNKSFNCFPLTFPYSYCCFIVKYSFQHKSYTEPFIVPYLGGVDWTASQKTLMAFQRCMHCRSGSGHRNSLRKSRSLQILQLGTPVFGAQDALLVLWPNLSNKEVWRSVLFSIIDWKVR